MDFEKLKDNNFILNSNANELKIISKLDNLEPLTKFAKIFCWGSSITGFAKNKKYTLEKGYKPLIQTRDIKKYGISWNKEYINENIYSENIKQIFNQKKIVIGRLTKDLQATVDTDNYYVGKSAIFIPKNIDDIYYICGILNSKLISYYYKFIFIDDFK